MNFKEFLQNENVSQKMITKAARGFNKEVRDGFDVQKRFNWDLNKIQKHYEKEGLEVLAWNKELGEISVILDSEDHGYRGKDIALVFDQENKEVRADEANY